MKQTFRNIKGTFDILPLSHSADGSPVASSMAWQQVESTIRSILERYSFHEIRTPFLEQIGLFERSVGAETDIVSKEMFAVPRLKETYVLRPELTASVMRAFIQHSLQQQPQGQRLYYIGPCFRAERPQKGRFRQFHQFGVELIGSPDPLADADVMAAMIAVFEEFGLTDLTLRLNSLGSGERRSEFIAALQAYLSKYEGDLTGASRRRLSTNPLRILDTKVEFERDLLGGAPRLSNYISPEDREHFETVKSYLDALDIAYVEDPLLVRGLDYYCRTAFELESADLGAQSAVAGGGRYDGLAHAIGWDRELPGVGFAAGMERLFLALQSREVSLPVPTSPDLYIVALGSDAKIWSLAVARNLRHSGLSVAFDVKSRSMKSQMKEANKLNAHHVLIIGDSELAAGQAELKEMAQGEQRTLSFDGIVDALVRLCQR